MGESKRGLSKAERAERLRIDEAVAVRVFGKRKPPTPVQSYFTLDRAEWIDGWFLETTGYDEGDRLIVTAPRYSSDLVLAMETLVPWLSARGVRFVLEGANSEGTIIATFYRQQQGKWGESDQLHTSTDCNWASVVAFFIAETALLEV